MLNPASLNQFLAAQLPAALAMLRQMVGINSFTLNRAGLKELGQFTADSFAPLGFTAEFIPSTNPKFGDHLVLTRSGHGPNQLALISHLDTVFSPAEEARNNFCWQLEGDRVFGPGTQDIKGGTVMMWLVLQALQTHAPAAFGATTWKILLNSAEEMFSPDFGDVCRARFAVPTLAALVFEPEGRLGNEHLIVVARKGRASWRVTVTGRGAHAGGKHSHGANAVVQLAQLIPHLAALTDYSRNLTFNVATVIGGTGLNRVPHEAVAEGEFRAFTPEVYQQAKSALLALAGPGEVKALADGFPCTIHVEILTETRPWPRNADTDRLFEFWRQAGETLLADRFDTISFQNEREPRSRTRAAQSFRVS